MALTQVKSDGIATGAVTATQIAANAVTVDDISDGSISTAKLSDSAVTNAKVDASAAIAGTKISPDFGAQDLTVDTNVLHVDATNDRVGVGTNTPAQNLHIASTGTTTQQISRTGLADGNQSDAAVIEFANGTGPVSEIRVGGDGDTQFNVRSLTTSTYTNGLFIQGSTGNVGIGNTSPAGTLHCEETGAICNLFVTSNVSTDATASRVALGNDLGDARLTMSLFGSTNERGVIGTEGSAPVVFQTGGTERLRILSGGGLTFNGDTAADNALDDYEEGTWTPAIASGGWTLDSTSFAKYVKIGKQVTVQCFIDFSGSGNSSDFTISGLPFTPPSQGYSVGVADFYKPGKAGIVVRVNSNSTTVSYIYSNESASTIRGQLIGTDIGAGYHIFTVTYQTA